MELLRKLVELATRERVQAQQDADQATRERVQAQQDADQATRERVQAQQDADQAEQQLASMYASVRDCIAGAPMTTQPLKYPWGKPPEEVKSSDLPQESTATTPSWLEVGPVHVKQWTDVEFGTWLLQAETYMVGEGKSLLNLILDDSKCSKDLQVKLNGTTFGEFAHLNHTDEATLGNNLHTMIWSTLQTIAGLEGSSSLHPAKKYVNINVHYGKKSRWRKQGPGEPLEQVITVAPQYSEMYKSDKAIDATFLTENQNLHETILPPMDSDDKLNAVHRKVAAAISRIIMEIKTDYHHPIKMALRPTKSLPKKDMKKRNLAVSRGLLSYMQSEWFNREFNPVAQVVTYAVVSRAKFFMIPTGNRCTYGRIEVSKNGEIQVLLTQTFDWKVPLPHQWSHYEILLRFILAGRGEWFIEEPYPNVLKEKFKRSKEELPTTKRRKVVGGDEESADDDGGGDASPPDVAFTSTTSPTTTTTTSAAIGPSMYPFSRLYWEDLWAPLRFAIPATHPALESSLDRLEGDAELITYGRSGPVYRKTLQGVDAVVKVVVLHESRRSENGMMVEGATLAAELQHEDNVYGRLKPLQGIYVPKQLWYGTIVQDMADCLVTEYGGVSLDDDEESETEGMKLTVPLVAGARAALQAVHEYGVLHNDVERRNFMVDDNGQVKMMDFAFSEFREDMDEETWKKKVTEELVGFDCLFGVDETSSADSEIDGNE